MTRVLVTGGSGFIGSKLVDALCDTGHKVRVLSRKNLAALEVRKDEVEFVKVDLLDTTFDLEKDVTGCSVVFNCAGDLHNEELMEPLHVGATIRLVEACKKVSKSTGQVIHWVQLSSVGCYGPGEARTERCVTEETTPAPKGVYEITKTQADEIIIDAADNVFSYSVLRPSNVYGPTMPNNSIRQWGQLIKKKLFFYVGKSDAISTYVHVDDVVDVLMLCGFDERAKNEIFNISNDCSQKTLVSAMAKSLNVSAPRLWLPESLMRFVATLFLRVKHFPVSHSRIDSLVARTSYPTSKLKAVLGYQPTRDIKETIVEAFLDAADPR